MYELWRLRYEFGAATLQDQKFQYKCTSQSPDGPVFRF